MTLPYNTYFEQPDKLKFEILPYVNIFSSLRNENYVV